MAFTYRQVKDLYDTLAESGATSVSLPEWSAEMNQLSNSDLFSEGLHDNFLKRSSVAVDRALEWTGLPDVTERFGRSVGEAIGDPEAGARIGRSLPRMTANFLPFLIPGGGLVAGAARLGGAALLSGAESYTATGSPAAGLLTGATTAALPGLTNAVEQAVLRRLGGRVVSGPLADAAGGVSQFNRVFPTTLGQGLASQAAGQGAAAVFSEGSGYGQDLLAGQPLHNPFSAETLLNLTLGQLPFAGIYATKGGKAALGGKASHEAANQAEAAIAKTKSALEVAAAQEALKNKTPLEQIPNYTGKQDAQAVANNNLTIQNLRLKQKALKSEPTEMSMEEWNKLTAEENRLIEAQQPQRDTLVGTKLAPETPRRVVEGVEVTRNKLGTWRMIELANNEANGDLAGKLIGYSTLHEPAPGQAEAGMSAFSLPEGYYTILPLNPKYGSKFAAKPEGQPELPTQPTPAERPFDHVLVLKDAESAIQAAQSNGEFHEALVKLNAVRESFNLPPLTDAQAARRKLFTKQKSDKAVAIDLLKQTERQLEAIENARLGDQFRAEQELAGQADPALADELNQLKQLEENISLKPGKHADKLLAGELNRMYREWVEGDRTAGWEAFSDKVLSALKTGKGLHEVVTKNPAELVAETPKTQDTLPIHDIMSDYAVMSLNDPMAVRLFNEWDGKAGTTLETEQRRFAKLYDELGHTMFTKPIKLEDAAEVNEVLKEVGVEFDNLNDLVQFASRRHVQAWKLATERVAAENAFHAPARSAQPSAGGGFVWGMQQYDPMSKKLGKHTLPKDGKLLVAQFKNMAGRDNRPLPDVEIEIARLIAPEAFEGDKVDVVKLQSLLEERGPVLETKTLGKAALTPEAKEFATLQHEFVDSAPPIIQANLRQTESWSEFQKDVEDYLRSSGPDLKLTRLATNAINQPTLAHRRVSEWWTPENQAKSKRYLELRETELTRDFGPSPRYSFLGPKSEQNMPGYVEGLVRLPIRDEKTDRKVYRTKEEALANAPSGAKTRGNASDGFVWYIPGQGKKYSGPHFGSEDTNVIAFFRGYEETLPNGKKAFHVIEVQNDVTVENGDGTYSIRDHPELGTFPNKNQAAKVAAEKVHPTLADEVWKTLALKAAINHARSIGADSIVLSDAETAMMTEGHDRVSPHPIQGQARTEAEALANIAEQGGIEPRVTPVQVENAQGERVTVYRYTAKRGAPLEPPQSGGMRLHYDTTLPSAMAKLTGERGEVVELGLHKGARREEQIYGGVVEEATPSGSPVFRDTSGNPKTQITGRLYPLQKAFANIDAQGGLTLSEPSRAPKQFVPDGPEDLAVVTGVGKDGQSLSKFLEGSTDPFVQALIKDLKGRVGNLLDRITVRFENGIPTSYAASGAFNDAHVVLSDVSLKLPPEFRDREYVHELIHGLTLNALKDPANAKKVEELNAFRQQLIDKLPEDMKELLGRAISSNFYRRYSTGKAKIDELGNPTQRQVLYGLLDNKELVTQGFSSNEMRSFMRTVKMPGGGAFKKFVNWVKTMVGFGENVKDTAFEAFLGHTDGLLTQGEYVAKLDNFVERYLEQQGVEGVLTKAYAKQATAIVKMQSYGTQPNELLDFLSLPQAFKSQDLARAEMALQKEFLQKTPNAEAASTVLNELGFRPEKAGIDELMLALLNGEVRTDALDVMPSSVTKYLYNKLDDMRVVLDSVRAATNLREGLVNLERNRTLKPSVETALKQIDAVLESKQMHDTTVQAIQEMMAKTAPDGYLDSVLSDDKSPALKPFLGDALEEGQKGLSWISRFLKPPSQMARDNPQTAEAIAKGYELQANARKMASEALKVLGADTNDPKAKLTHEAVQRLAKGLAHPKVEKAIDRWLFANQKNGRDTGSTILLPDSHPEVQKALVGLTPKERADVVDVVAKLQISQQVMQAQIVEKMRQIAATNGATLIGRSTGLKVAQNLALADEVVQAMQADFNDPVQLQQAQQRLAQVQQKLDPKVFGDLVKYVQMENEKINAWRQHFDENPAWVSGQRYGKYLVRFTRGKRLFVLGADSKAHARKLAEGGQIESIELNRASDDDAPPVLGPEVDKLFGRLRELEDNQIQMLRENGMPDDEIEALRRTSPVAQFERETAARQGIPGVTPPPRGLTRGAEDVPWLSNHFSWVQKASTYWSRQLFRAQTRAHLLEGEIAANPELQSWLRTHFDNILHQDPESVQKFKRFMTTWFMGYNPASVIVNAAQPFVTHVAELTAMTGKPLDSYRRIIKALNEVAGHSVRGLDWATPEHSQLMKDAVEALEVGYGKFDDEAAAQESIATNYKRILAGNKPQTLGQRLGNAAGMYSTVGMWMFQQGEQVNNRAALLAAFDFYREKGLSYEQARDKAFEFNRAVNFGGGRANRPVGAFSGRGKFPRGVAMLGTALQSYVLGTTFQLIRYLKQGLFRPAGLTPAERHAALKAGVQLLGTQFAAAGLLGLPFVSGAIALLDKAFPELELNKKLREGVTGLLGDDDENGSLLSDIAMTGVPSMFGWDLQSRLSMGNTVPGVSEINGFQPEQLFGPAASLVSNFVNGTTKLARGDSNGALNYVPPALRKLAELVKEDGQVQDYRGRPLFDPTVGEQVGIGLGFNPKRLSDFNAATRVAEQNRLVSTRREGQFRQSLAEEALKGNFGTVRTQLLERAKQDKDYDIREAALAVVRASEELTFPRDLRREGTESTSGSRSALLRTFNLPPSLPNEVQRVQFRQQMLARLGVQSDQTRELSIASLVDRLRQSNPEATRAELRRMAEQVLRRNGQSFAGFQPVP